MCLITTKESFQKASKIRKTNQKIFAYKIIDYDNKTLFQDNFDWPDEGIVKSNRNGTRRTSKETRDDEIHKGLHLFVNQPEICWRIQMSECNYRNPYCSLRNYQQCTYENPVNKVLEVEFSSKDVVSYGFWGGLESVVVTKCEVLKVIQ